MARILELPVETLHEIVEALCNIAQPLLYHSFIFNSKKAFQEKNLGYKLLRFADTVARQPELRKSVKEFQLDLQFDDDRAREVGCVVPPNFDLGGLRGAAPQYFNSDKKRGMWEKKKTIQVFPHVEAILSILPRLEILKLNVGGAYGLRDLCLGLGPESAQYLANVTELALCGPTGYNPARFDMIMPLISLLSQLKKLRLKNFDIAGVFRKREDRESAQWHVAERTLRIEELCIRNCTMTNEVLVRIIRSCRRLVKFDYKAWKDHEFEERRRIWREEPDVNSFHAALSLHKSSLVELSHNWVNVFEKMADYNPAKTLPAYPSFQDFSHLKTFKIEYRRMRFENLPPNLTHLYLYDCRDVQNDAEVEAWKAIKRTFCPDIEVFEIMCTDHCRSIQYQLKYMHFQWGCWTEQTREWDKDGFNLKVWFKDFIDGTYHFSQGSDDTGDIDSNGDKINDEEEEEEEGGEEDNAVEDDDDDNFKNNDDDDNFEDNDEGGDDDNDINNDKNSESNENKINLASLQQSTSTNDPGQNLDNADHHGIDTQLRSQSPTSDAHSSHTFDWVDDLRSDFDEMDVDLDDAHSIPSNGTFEWVDELISEAEDEDEDEYPPRAEDTRAILLADEDEDDGWMGGEWRAPRKIVIVQGKGRRVRRGGKRVAMDL